MPIYNYECKMCGRKFEELIRDKEETGDLKCPSCGSREIKKLFSTFSVGKSSKSVSPPCRTARCPGGCPSMPE